MKYSAEYTSGEKERIRREWADLMVAARKRCTKDFQLEMVRKAFEFASADHDTIRRSSGAPYILHPIAVAKIVVSEIGLGWKSICAALLHDVPEIGNHGIDDIRAEFGDKIASLVDGQLKIKAVLSGTQGQDPRVIQAESFKRMLLTLNDDARVVLIKLADRLHNTRNIEYMTPSKRERILSENMYLFIPMAHHLGLYSIKSEMENIFLRFEKPDEYNSIMNRISADSTDKDKMIKEFLRPVREALDNSGIEYTVTQRVKTPYSIWNKMNTKHIGFDEIADLYAVRIIFSLPPEETIATEIQTCRRIADMICSIYDYRKDRVRDWLEQPKSNGYQALHLTFITSGGRNIEVQIRSRRMDDIAEKGLAAHWKYKKNCPDTLDGQLDLWLQQIKDILAESDIDSLEKLEQVHKNFVKI